MTNITQLQIDVAEWLLANQAELYESIHSKHIPDYHLFPGSLADLYEDTYKDNVLKLLKNEIVSTFGLTSEQLMLLYEEEQYKLILGDNFFKLPTN